MPLVNFNAVLVLLDGCLQNKTTCGKAMDKATVIDKKVWEAY